MEFIISELQIAAIALLTGLLIGILAYRLLGRSTRESEKIVEELDAAKAELSEYRTSVNQHFHKTSELVNEMTQNYVKVYQHLAQGAQSLGDDQGFDNLLEHQKGKVAIAIDDSVETAAEVPDRIVEPEAAAEDIADIPVDEPVDEHAAPYSGPSAAEVSPEKAEAAEVGAEQAEAPDAADSSGQPAEAESEVGPADAEAAEAPTEAAATDKTPEAVLNVDVLGKAIDQGDRDDEPKVVATAADGEKKAEARPTTH